MNKRNRMREQILRHGLRLQRIFEVDDLPITLAKRVHRLEVKAHKLAEDYCNGLIESDGRLETKEKKILKSLDNILNYTEKNIPIFVNGDPRGYALKIDDEYVRKHNIDIYRDMGGYGILAPEFDGN